MDQATYKAAHAQATRALTMCPDISQAATPPRQKWVFTSLSPFTLPSPPTLLQLQLAEKTKNRSKMHRPALKSAKPQQRQQPVMSSLLVPPRKKSQGVDYPTGLNRFLSSTQGQQEAADHRDAIKALGEMRAQTLSVTEPSEASLQNSVQYWAQVSLLGKRIDFNQVGLTFTWVDAFKGPSVLAPSEGKVTSMNVNLEIAAVLFNTAVLFMVHGSHAHKDGNGGTEGLKIAAQSFKKAAGMFLGAAAAASKIDQAISVDLSPECLSMLETMCLAHGQRCFYEKAKDDKMKDAILAKLASAAANMYGQIASSISGAHASDRLAKHFKGSAWIHDLAGEHAVFRAAAHMHAAKALEIEHRGMKKGKELGHYAVAVSALEEAAKLKLSSTTRAAQIKVLLSEAHRAHGNAKKENETVYHEPEEKTAADPEGKAMVKSENLPDPQVVWRMRLPFSSAS